MANGLLFDNGTATAEPTVTPSATRETAAPLVRREWEAKAGRSARVTEADIAAATALIDELESQHGLPCNDRLIALHATLLARRNNLTVVAAANALTQANTNRKHTHEQQP